MSKTKLKPISPKSDDDFGNLLKMFGAQKTVDVVDRKSTNKNVDSESTENIVDSNSTRSVVSKSTQKKSLVDSKSTKKDVDYESTKLVDQKSTKNIVDFNSTRSVVSKSTQKKSLVDYKSTSSISWLALEADFYLIGVWQVLFDTFGNEKISDSIRSLAKRFSIDPAQFYRILRKLEASQMVRMESSKRSTQIEILTPKA